MNEILNNEVMNLSKRYVDLCKMCDCENKLDEIGVKDLTSRLLLLSDLVYGICVCIARSEILFKEIVSRDNEIVSGVQGEAFRGHVSGDDRIIVFICRRLCDQKNIRKNVSRCVDQIKSSKEVSKFSYLLFTIQYLEFCIKSNEQQYMSSLKVLRDAYKFSKMLLPNFPQKYSPCSLYTTGKVLIETCLLVHMKYHSYYIPEQLKITTTIGKSQFTEEEEKMIKSAKEIFISMVSFFGRKKNVIKLDTSFERKALILRLGTDLVLSRIDFMHSIGSSIRTFDYHQAYLKRARMFDRLCVLEKKKKDFENDEIVSRYETIFNNSGQEFTFQQARCSIHDTKSRNAGIWKPIIQKRLKTQTNSRVIYVGRKAIYEYLLRVHLKLCREKKEDQESLKKSKKEILKILELLIDHCRKTEPQYKFIFFSLELVKFILLTPPMNKVLAKRVLFHVNDVMSEWKVTSRIEAEHKIQTIKYLLEFGKKEDFGNFIIFSDSLYTKSPHF